MTRAVIEAAHGILTASAAKRAPVRLIGGVAIWTRATSQTRQRFERDYADIDLVAHRAHSKLVIDLMKERQFVEERRFNAIHGHSRLMFHSGDLGFQVDVFLDTFLMSHRIEFKNRLEVEAQTVPAAELLLSKLQIAAVNSKDLNDAVMLLADHELADRDGPFRINIEQVVTLCARDWGLFTTVSDNLAKARVMLSDGLHSPITEQILGKIDELQAMLQGSPKSLAWQARSLVGRRYQWYETPDEVG